MGSISKGVWRTIPPLRIGRCLVAIPRLLTTRWKLHQPSTAVLKVGASQVTVASRLPSSKHETPVNQMNSHRYQAYYKEINLEKAEYLILTALNYSRIGKMLQIAHKNRTCYTNQRSRLPLSKVKMMVGRLILRYKIRIVKVYFITRIKGICSWRWGLTTLKKGEDPLIVINLTFHHQERPMKTYWTQKLKKISIVMRVL